MMASVIASVQKVIDRRDRFFHAVFIECLHTLYIGIAILFFNMATVFAQPSDWSCGSLVNSYGPYDYRTDRDKLPIVLNAHFTPEVEALIRGKTGTLPGGDIDYTLRAIPNNHRALMAMMRLGEKEKTPQPSGSKYTIECWFERATLFRPDDAIVRMIYSTYLNSINRIKEANLQLEVAAKYAQDNPLTHYNIGLHYFDLKNYEKALFEAHKAASLGLDRSELREQLKAVGKWAEAPVATEFQVPSNGQTGPTQ
jgi:tetratricopeptide (TPR) repeat protein